MKKLSFVLLLVLSVLFQSHANNLIMGTPTISGSTISFTIQWDNSWKVSTGPSNWDAVWVFVKRQHCDQPNQNPWSHETLSATAGDHTVTGSQLQVDLPSDNRGVFIRRSSAGIGNISQATVTLTLTSAVGSDNIGVYGMEMVAVPQGNFYAGDGNDPQSSQRHNFTDGNSNNPLLIDANKQTAGLGAATAYQKEGYGSTVSLPSTFPTGYNNYYCMKYEITTAQYVSFLNTLTYNQQLRLQEDPNTTPPTSATGTVMNARFGYRIEVKTPGVSTTSLTPAVYANDANDNNTFDEDADALGVAVSIRIKDFLAYLDWAALRPMSEFEYEKACRGPITPVLNEFAWGTTDINHPDVYWNIEYKGKSTEYLKNWAPLGPAMIQRNWMWRVGIAATGITDRVHAGATYYGILDMTGNVFERCVGGQNFDYSTFTTTNGDGSITSDAYADVTGWPINANRDTYESYYIRRGASTYNSINYEVSSRNYMNWADGNRDVAIGGRGVRSF
jgi:formylglycine-generating enzyme required for sulfatase activity